MNGNLAGLNETLFPLTRREARRPLPLKRGRGGAQCLHLQREPINRLEEEANQAHLAPVLGGEVATSLRVAGEGATPHDILSALFRAFLLVALLLPGGFASGQDATFTTEQKSPIRLSESLQARLAIEGPAPLRVELPKPFLDPITDRDWKIQPVGNVSVVSIAERRERWTQTYRLDPYVPGKGLPVIFAAVKVNGREVQPGGFEVTVLSTVAEPKAENAKPVTSIEELPDPDPISPPRVAAWQLVLLCGGIIAVIAFVLWMRPKPPPMPPHEWAIGALDELERAGVANRELVARAAEILRELIERQFGIPATKLTTAELLATTAWTVEQTDPLRRILDRCDLAKFAGDIPNDDGCRDLLARCRNWLNEVGTVSTGPR
ncbi:MAG: DUF4381 family protein [Planctomycetes bacterium]|nr:DUF4381 family protein [Planctomycetota bacterium]